MIEIFKCRRPRFVRHGPSRNSHSGMWGKWTQCLRICISHYYITNSFLITFFCVQPISTKYNTLVLHFICMSNVSDVEYSCFILDELSVPFDFCISDRRSLIPESSCSKEFLIICAPKRRIETDRDTSRVFPQTESI